MVRPPPRPTRTATLCPYTTPFRSPTKRGDSLSRIPNPESRIPALLHLDRQRRQPAVGELGLGRGQFGGGAVRPQAHAVDGLALDHGRLDACVQAERGDPRLDRLGVAGRAEGAGLADVAGLVVLAGRDGRWRLRGFGGRLRGVERESDG